MWLRPAFLQDLAVTHVCVSDEEHKQAFGRDACECVCCLFTTCSRRVGSVLSWVAPARCPALTFSSVSVCESSAWVLSLHADRTPVSSQFSPLAED